MNKIKLPKKSFKGLKVYCNKCKRYNPTCSHDNHKLFRGVIHIVGTKKKSKIKNLASKTYESAVKELITLKQELETNNYNTEPKYETNNYSIVGAVIKYNQYLSGTHSLKHLIKNVSEGHKKETMKFLRLFCNSLKKRYQIENKLIVEIGKKDVSFFYEEMEVKYSSRTFNKCMMAVKGFFKFLIEVEQVDMKNPFAVFIRKKVVNQSVDTITKNEFEAILKCVDSSPSQLKLGGKGEIKNMFKDYLKDGFKLFLLTGLRREEVVELRWSDIYFHNETYFFSIQNKKVERNENVKGTFNKYIPINSDLIKLLNKLGYEKMKSTNDYILAPNRTETNKTMMNNLSKSFTYYRKQAKISKEISLKHLRKTYISWVNQVLGRNTGKITSHSSQAVLNGHYLDQKILSVIEKGVLEIEIFD